MKDKLIGLQFGVKQMIFVFIGGIVLGAVVAVVNVPKTKPVSTTKLPVAQTAIVSPKEAQWRDLKNVDDQLITSCSQNFGIVSDIFDAQKALNFDKVATLNVSLAKGADHASVLADERKSILKGLGY